MTIPALLTIVASLLVGQHTPVTCALPLDQTRWGDVIGWTYYTPTPHIYLKDCNLDTRLDYDTLGHEILHAKHPYWEEKQVGERENLMGNMALQTLRGIGSI